MEKVGGILKAGIRNYGKSWRNFKSRNQKSRNLGGMKIPRAYFLDLEPEVTETAAAGLPLRGSQMDATIRDSDGSGKCDLFLSFSPSVSYRQHPSEIHARAAYKAKNFIGWARLALAYPPKLQKRPK